MKLKAEDYIDNTIICCSKVYFYSLKEENKKVSIICELNPRKFLIKEETFKFSDSNINIEEFLCYLKSKQIFFKVLIDSDYKNIKPKEIF